MINKYLLTSLLVFKTSFVLAQIHSEFGIVKKIMSDSVFNTFVDSVHLYKEHNFLEFSSQFIDRVSFGRNTQYFYSRPGVYTSLSFSRTFKRRNFYFKFNPNLVYYNSCNFPDSISNFPKSHPFQLWKAFLENLNRYDNSDFSILNEHVRFYGGSSELSFRLRKVELRISTAQLDWGVSYGDRLVISSNAPGFPHVAFSKKLISQSKKYYFVFDIAYGFLNSTRFNYEDNNILENNQPVLRVKNKFSRSFSGSDIKYVSLRKNPFLLGINFATIFYTKDFKRYTHLKIPLFNYIFSFQDMDAHAQFAASSFYFKIKIPSELIKFWGEYSLNNRGFSPHFIFVNDTLPRAFVVGAEKTLKSVKKYSIVLFFQYSNLGVSTLYQAKSFKSMYLSSEVSQGFTNFGKVIGNGLGPGGESFYISIGLLKKKTSVNLYLERVVKNQDFTYAVFNNLNPASTRIHDIRRNWVDLLTGFSFFKRKKNIESGFTFNFLHSFNYMWKIKNTSSEFWSGFQEDENGARISFSLRRYF
jgi:hypothetical protein